MRVPVNVPPSLRSKFLGDLLGIESEREQGVFPFSSTPEGRIRAMVEAVRRNKALAQIAGSTESFENYINDDSALQRLIASRLGMMPDSLRGR